MRFKLDYDDAYQYALAEKDNLILVSFDSDFDRTKRGKATPADLLKFMSLPCIAPRSPDPPGRSHVACASQGLGPASSWRKMAQAFELR